MDSLENLKAPSMPTIIVGAGWAGLSAAFSLAQQHKKIILLEAAPQPGGRARGVSFGKEIVDNGQHLLIGAYTHTLQLLQDLGLRETDYLERRSLDWHMLDPQKTGFSKKNRLSILEHLKIIRFFKTLKTMNFQLSEDVSVQEFLVRLKQPPGLIHKLWGPMALAALSTPLQEASAQVFLQVLKDSFSEKNRNSNFLFPKTDLSTLLPNPIIEYLKTHQNTVLYNQRVQRLEIENGRCTGVRTANRTFKGNAVILATPPHITAALLKTSLNTLHCETLIKNLEQFHYQPITTAYLQYPEAIQLKTPMIGLVNTQGQWIFDRAFANQANILSIVITGKGEHLELNHADLVQKLDTELRILFPKFQKGAPLDYRVICEKRAAFSCTVGIAAYRPAQITPYPNLYLAGDYTQAYYPATLESAVRSGIKAAQCHN
jgi:hydroxysqualene dehydroxylase